jgi:uncharacterized protein
MLRAVELDPEEIRVLACLAEKQLTTPAQYPLTLNALTLACNQTSSRDPVVAYDEATVEAAVTRAKTEGLARFHHPSHGRSALRFGHMLDEQLGLDASGLAVLTVLMLRGAQTPGELRTRTQRMAEFSTPRQVEDELERLQRHAPPLVTRLGRQPGQKEERYAHLLGATVDSHPVTPTLPDQVAAADATTLDRAVTDAEPPPRPPVSASLVGDVAELRAEVAALRHDVDDLRAQLGL